MSKPNNVVKQIKRATRRKFSAEEKIRIVLEGLRGEIGMSELCRKEGIAASGFLCGRSSAVDRQLPKINPQFCLS